jgi:bacterioferritin-associated ferredoxin
MYVCHCRAVNDRTILTAAAEGALTVDDLSRACGAGSDCGGCHAMLEELLAACGRTAADAPRVPELVG